MAGSGVVAAWGAVEVLALMSNAPERLQCCWPEVEKEPPPPPLNLSHLKAGNAHSPKSSLLVRWLLSRETPLCLSVCAEKLAYKPQTGWLVLGALWLYYIVNFGTVLTLTAFPWLVETLKYTYYICTIFRLESGESYSLRALLHFFVLEWLLWGKCRASFSPVIKICFFTTWSLSDITLSRIFTSVNTCLCCPYQISLIPSQLHSITFSSSMHLSCVSSTCVWRLQILYTVLIFSIYIILLLTKLLRGGFTMHVFIFVYR